jgi:hypothetical protein
MANYQKLLPMGLEANREERSVSNPVEFVTAGKAVFTILNEKTGRRFTYRVKKHKKSPIYFVSVLSGPDNTSNYSYIGTIFNEEDFRLTRNSKAGPEAPSVIAFTWFMRHIRRLPPALKVYHENRCARCGRALTTPESVQRGFGPECWQRVS